MKCAPPSPIRFTTANAASAPRWPRWPNLQPQTLPALPAELPGLMPATAALLYTLLDQDVSVWLPPLPADTLASLRFHTGLRLATAPEQADFVVLPLGAPLPPLAALKAGEPEYPDRSATVLLETAGFNAEQVEACGRFRRAAPLRHERRAGRFLAAVAGQSRPLSAGRGHLADQRRARGRPAAQHPRQEG